MSQANIVTLATQPVASPVVTYKPVRAQVGDNPAEYRMDAPTVALALRRRFTTKHSQGPKNTRHTVRYTQPFADVTGALSDSIIIELSVTASMNRTQTEISDAINAFIAAMYDVEVRAAIFERRPNT